MNKNARFTLLIILIVGMLAVSRAPVVNAFFWRGILAIGAFGCSFLNLLMDRPKSKGDWVLEILLLLLIAFTAVYSFLLHFEVLYPFCPLEWIKWMKLKYLS